MGNKAVIITKANLYRNMQTQIKIMIAIQSLVTKIIIFKTKSKIRFKIK